MRTHKIIPVETRSVELFGTRITGFNDGNANT